MEKLKAIVSFMAKSAIEENKTEEFFDTTKVLKIRLFSRMLSGEITKADAENMRNHIVSVERSVNNAINECCNSLV